MHGEGYLDWAEEAIVDFLKGIRTVAFIPYALQDVDAYAKAAKERFDRWGIEVGSVHESKDPAGAAQRAEAFFVGGGNTFRLLSRLYETGLVDAIRERVESAAAAYIGSSAGTNVACPTIRTTNDMPITWPPSFDAIGLVPFQINPHYLDPDPESRHMGETREQRIREFHEMNELPVVGLREGSWLRVEGDAITLGGRNPARVFHRGTDGVEVPVGSRLAP